MLLARGIPVAAINTTWRAGRHGLSSAATDDASNGYASTASVTRTPTGPPSTLTGRPSIGVTGVVNSPRPVRILTTTWHLANRIGKSYASRVSTGDEPLSDRDSTDRDITSLVKALLNRRGGAKKKEELATALGMSPSSLSHALTEDGPRRRYWQAHEVLALSRYYNVSIEAFYGDPEAREEVREELREELRAMVDQQLDEEI